MKVLIVDDEKQLVKALGVIMKKNGIDTDAAYDGEEAYEYAVTGLYDVIVLDWMLPKADGCEVLSKIRSEGISTPVLMLTAKSDVSDKITGLETGADDYLTKPFDSDELIARVKALTRRKGEFFGSELTFGDLVLELPSHTLKCGGNGTSLGAKEFKILEMMMRSPENLFSKELIIEKIWGFDSDAEYNNVEVYISFIRRKLAALGSYVSIRSLRGAGYRLEKTA